MAILAKEGLSRIWQLPHTAEKNEESTDGSKRDRARANKLTFWWQQSTRWAQLPNFGLAHKDYNWWLSYFHIYHRPLSTYSHVAVLMQDISLHGRSQNYSTEIRGIIVSIILWTLSKCWQLILLSPNYFELTDHNSIYYS